MKSKFNRTLISEINSNLSIHAAARIIHNESKKVAVPEEKTFRHIFENAIKGNEMAAVLLDEWHKSCKAANEKEEKIIKSINKAVNKIFE